MIFYRMVIPEIYGYGLEVYADTPEECVKRMRRLHRKWTGQYKPENPKIKSFKGSLEYFGATITLINTNNERTAACAEGQCGIFVDWKDYA